MSSCGRGRGNRDGKTDRLIVAMSRLAAFQEQVYFIAISAASEHRHRHGHARRWTETGEWMDEQLIRKRGKAWEMGWGGGILKGIIGEMKNIKGALFVFYN